MYPKDRDVLYNHFLATAKLRSQDKPHWWPTAVDWDFIQDKVSAVVKSRLENEPNWWPTAIEWGAPGMKESGQSHDMHS